MAGTILFLSFCVRISLRGKFISHRTADKHLGSEKAIEGAERGQGAGHTVIFFFFWLVKEVMWELKELGRERGSWERDGSPIQLSSLTHSSTLTFNPVYFQQVLLSTGELDLGGAFAS